MKRCPDLPECAGHVAKFDNCLTEALYTACASMVGWADEETGDVESPGGFGWLVLWDDTTVIEGHMWGGFDLTVAGNQHFILTTDDHGHVWLSSFESKGEAQSAWQAFEDAYGQWLDLQECSCEPCASCRQRLSDCCAQCPFCQALESDRAAMATELQSREAANG